MNATHGTAKQGGISLVEIPVALLIAFAMRSLGTVQKGVSKSSESGRMYGEVEEAVQVMGRDLRNLGLKHLFYATAPGVFTDTILSQASYLPSDSSSFNHRDGTLFDTLTFLRPKLDAAGALTFWQATSPFSTSTARRYAFEFQGFGDAGFVAGLGSLEAVICSSAGKLYLSKIAFSEISQGDLTWAAAPTLLQKKSTRAVRIYLLVGSPNPMFGAHSDTMTLANASLNFTDGKGRSLLDEIIPTPNNGP